MEELEIQDQTNQPPPRHHHHRRHHHHHHHHHHQQTSSYSSATTPSRARTKTTTISSDDKFECSVKSCAAATIADCVALCCCPCAVVNLVAFALLKVPWTVGKRCLAAGKTSLRNRRKTKKKKKTSEAKSTDDGKSDVVYRGWWTEEGITDISSSEEDHERVWLEELCQLGHLGFGRVSSFTGINPQIN